MVKTLLKKLLTCFLALAFSIILFHAQSQTSCSQKLKELQKGYDAGLLEGIPAQLEPCMVGGFSKIEKLQAYRLLILTYLFLDEQELAGKKMKDLLIYEPDYRPNKALDPIEFIALYESYMVQPYISFGGMLGANRSAPRVINNFGAGNTEEFPTSYDPGINFNVGLTFDYLLYRKLFLTADGLFVIRNFSTNSKVLPNSETSVNENQTNLVIPLTLKWVIIGDRLKFFIRGGGAVELVVSAQDKMVRKNTEMNQIDYVERTVDFSDQRNKLNLAAVVGAGLHYKMGYGYLIFDARYYYGLSNIVKTSGRYSTFTPQIANYGYIDSDMALDNIQVNFGYMFSLYRVRKLKSKLAVE